MSNIDSSLRYWINKMDTAEQNGDMKTYNKCVEKVQELEYLQGY